MNRPDARELLEAARETLMNEVFPSVSEHLRYEVRMIASAMGIAAREAKMGANVSQDEVAAYTEVLPETAAIDSTSLESARQAMKDAIRAGSFDAPEQKQEQLQAVLQKVVLNALAISNPKVVRPPEGTR
ncbi:MAG: hypothetical protein KBT82_18090 [Marinobacter sp.]|uniref:DUF6285 domain-containing protein n=1 Tax=Marinobacter sp. TaxID=50741 RepID=UPI001B5764DE|nr:DUF6285 domain-containing protein [Marinobacter sp.]MBQ0745097.1 hypothetical protein [Marinobacter sp.]MBQ0816056.1 hypothetical protein [Marinobacter sp.]|tara:strand:+ start:9194 stop:9583 length:390 start_codon:yes stop_codon:yes gene_type:complete